MDEYSLMLLSAECVEKFRVRLLSLKAVTNISLSKHVVLKQPVAHAATAGGGHNGGQECSHPPGFAEHWYLVDGLLISLPGRALHFVCLEEKAPQKEVGSDHLL